KPNPVDVLATILVRVPPRTFVDGAAANLPRAVTVRDLYTGAYAVPLGVVTEPAGKDQVYQLWMGFDGGRPWAEDPKAGDDKVQRVLAQPPIDVKVSGGTPVSPSSVPSPAGGPMPMSGAGGGGGTMPPGGFGLAGGLGGFPGGGFGGMGGGWG